MRPDMVVLFEPLIDDSLGLAGVAKPFSVENLSANDRTLQVFSTQILGVKKSPH